MNTKRWLMASIAAFVVVAVLEYVLNEILLADLYRQTAAVWRPQTDMQRLMWLWTISHAIAALVFTLIYAQGYERSKAGPAQGARYGLYMGIFVSAPTSLGFYAVLPIPAALALYWFVGGVVVWAVTGAVVGALYQKP